MTVVMNDQNLLIIFRRKQSLGSKTKGSAKRHFSLREAIGKLKLQSSCPVSDEKHHPSKLIPFAGPSNSTAPGLSQPPSSHRPAQTSKLARNKRLPVTMITPSGTVEPSKKKGKGAQVSRKKKVRAEKGRERAVEVEGRLEVKVREREDRKVSRQRAGTVSSQRAHRAVPDADGGNVGETAQSEEGLGIIYGLRTCDVSTR